MFSRDFFIVHKGLAISIRGPYNRNTITVSKSQERESLIMLPEKILGFGISKSCIRELAASTEQ